MSLKKLTQYSDAPTNVLPKFRLRTTLVVPFVLQIMAAVGLVSYLSFRNGQKAVNDLASQLRNELSSRIERELKSYLTIPHDINQLNATAVNQGDIDIANATNLSQMLQQSKIFPFSYSIYCADQDGNLTSVGRDETMSKTVYFWSLNPSTRQHMHQYTIDERGNRLKFLRDVGFFDPRPRPWYKGALQRQQPFWTEVYPDFNSSLPIITASQPVYASSGKMIGVCATDVLLPEEFREFLTSLKIGQNGKAFIIDRAGQIISSSTQESLTVGTGDDTKLIHASESSEPLIRKTAEFLQQKFGSFQQIQQSQQLDFSLNGQHQFVQVSPFRDNKGLNWLIVIAVPESDFMGQINVNTRNTIQLALAALVFAIILGILTARWITRPILRVSQASKAIAEGDLRQHVASSSIVEIETLTNSFNSMAGQLQASFAALTQSEAQNRAIVEALPDLLFRANGEGTYLADPIGQNRLRALFAGARSLAGVSIYDSLPPPLAHQRVQAIQQALRTGELQVYEQQLIVNSQTIDEEVRIVKIADNEVLIMVRDISDRKQAEAALRVAEENYRGIFENALEGIFQSTPEGRFISVNPAMARIYGYSSPKEMLTCITDIGEQTYVDPAKREEFKRLIDQQGQLKDVEYQIYQKDGSIVWIEENTRAVQDAEGNVLYYEGIIQNITERKQQKEILESMVKQRTIELADTNSDLQNSFTQLAAANQEITMLNQRLQSENLRMSAELAVTRQLQQMILPKEQELKQIAGLEIAGFMEPADEVGGDYYDVLQHNGSVKIGIGDVTGHGLESGVLMIMVQTAVRTLLANDENDPRRFLSTINQVIYDNARRMNSNKNLSLALLDYQAGQLKLSGQHEEILVVRANGEIERIDTIDLGFFLGLVPDISEFIAQAEVQLQSGDGVILYTDGITEAENEAKECYSLERLCQVVSKHWSQSAAEIRQAIVADVQAHIGQQKIYDDITLLVLKQK